MAAAVPVGVVRWFRSRGIPVTAAAHAMLKNEGVQCVEHLKLLEPLGSGKPGWDTVVQDLNNIQKRSAAIVIQQLCRNSHDPLAAAPLPLSNTDQADAAPAPAPAPGPAAKKQRTNSLPTLHRYLVRTRLLVSAADDEMEIDGEPPVTTLVLAEDVPPELR